MWILLKILIRTFFGFWIISQSQRERFTRPHPPRRPKPPRKPHDAGNWNGGASADPPASRLGGGKGEPVRVLPFYDGLPEEEQRR